MGSKDGTGPGMRTWLRWVPAAVVPAVVAAGVLAGSIPARAGDPLPEKSAAEVLSLLARHSARSFSGTVEQSADLGLPGVPAISPTSGPASAGGAAASVAELLTGRHKARIFMNGPARMRVQVLDRLAERDVVRRDSDVWFYDFRNNAVVHLALPDIASGLPLPAPDAGRPGSVPPTPEGLARKFLDAADASTEVTVGPDTQVAGRPAYSLVLVPRTRDTLVENAEIAVDGQTGMPLKVTVMARGQEQPAFQAGFTNLSLAAPEDAVFSFVPPPGATVKEIVPGPVPSGGAHLRDPAAGKPTVTGEGWETVVGFPAAAGKQLAESLLADPLLSRAAVDVPGGRLLSTALVNVLLTDDGRIFLGMVPAERLQAAAGKG